jgi:hypothetical protein
MTLYLVNKDPQPSGEHELHRAGCPTSPDEDDQLPLGRFENCREAVSFARRYYSRLDGCRNCCPECHSD